MRSLICKWSHDGSLINAATIRLIRQPPGHTGNHHARQIHLGGVIHRCRCRQGTAYITVRPDLTGFHKTAGNEIGKPLAPAATSAGNGADRHEARISAGLQGGAMLGELPIALSDLRQAAASRGCVGGEHPENCDLSPELRNSGLPTRIEQFSRAPFTSGEKTG
jgi:hypothetical protein